MPTRIRKIEVQGFRSFGSSPQAVDLPDTVAVFWGGNSQGKTSLAEAFEFLLTGQIVRRDMLASTKDEFCEALRGAHLPLNVPVQVAAEIACPDGKTRRLTRTLLNDYGKGAGACKSAIQIDGQRAAEEDLVTLLGIKLSPPPLRAPVLAQHTLGYLFSASPADRASYFRAVLDTQDLEDFRVAVAGLAPLLNTPILAGLTNLTAIEGIEQPAPAKALIRGCKSVEAIETQAFAALEQLLKHLSVAPAATIAGRAEQLEAEMEVRQAKTFPLALFGRKAEAPWMEFPADAKETIDTFEKERTAIDAETRRLVDLFRAALALPHLGTSDAVDCPLCETPQALTAHRRAAIRLELQKAEAYQASEKGLLTLLASIGTALDMLASAVSNAIPKLAHVGSAKRRDEGFTYSRLVELSGNAQLVTEWLKSLLALLRAARAAECAIDAAQDLLTTYDENIDKWQGSAALSDALKLVRHRHSAFEAASANYLEPTRKLYEPVKEAVDGSTSTKGWSALIEVSRIPANLHKDLEESRKLEDRRKDLERALKQIDAATGSVLDQKFADLSTQVAEWWERLRPGESTYFEGVQRRSSTSRRTIDLRVSMSANEDRSDAKVRNAVAVLSQSQLHCLGLALFLARTVQEGTGFIVLDDPVLTSDDDFRPNFNSSVIEALLAEGVQVIALTQDYSSWKDIGHRWSHREVAQLQIIRNDPRLGTELRSESDALATMLAKAQPLIRSQEPSQRKEGASLLRQGIERFGKELLVRDRLCSGDGMASITDYDGKNFSTYSGKVLALLTKDPSHRGKLNSAYAYVTSGPHDDAPPSAVQLRQASGDLKQLKKEYLS